MTRVEPPDLSQRFDRPGEDPPLPGWRARLHEIVFRSDTRAGRAFDVVLLVAIVGSVAAVLAESVEPFRLRHGPSLRAAEWLFTGLFTVEYGLRLLAVRRQLAYATSFFGVVDLLALLPTYLSLIAPGTQSLLVIRALRLLRVFRVLRLPQYLDEATYLREALRSARRKITVFVFTVLMIVLIVGATIYVIEGPAHGFTSIPKSMYWAIVTLTTVGYGDLAPRTPPGQILASALMIVGYGIIAVPTGIVTAELVSIGRGRLGVAVPGRVCPRCRLAGHDADAGFCKACGGPL